MDHALFLDIIKTLGLPGLIFIIWWFDYKKIIEMQKITEEYKDLCEKYCRMSEEQMEIITLNIQGLSRIEQKIEDNRFCPLVRGEKKVA